MFCERSISPALRRWGRRIGFRMDRTLRAFDPVKEYIRRLFPNDHHEARSPFADWGLVTSYRSLVWPFTPLAGFRLVPTRGA